MHTYITTTIPYVNGRPHLGHALEYVQADVLARHARARGGQVRFQAGTDDNSLKNVLAAQAAGLDTRAFTDRNGAAFLALDTVLRLSVDDVIRTGSDPRHRPGVEKLWRACAHDLYRKSYQGLYCTGCEQFYTSAELDADGRCPEHGVPPEPVAEQNWFFRLSRYAEPLRAAIESGALRITPRARRNEVLAFIGAGLQDFSASRPAQRARGWGIPVPGDPSQVIYVWWDALGSYLTALDGDAYDTWWAGSDRRIHCAGKGVLRFHAVYWPAMLLSAGLPLPTEIALHDYLTVNGAKISKSAGVPQPDPAALAARYGADALRWWLLREVPRTGDTDFTEARLTARADGELANGIGNLVSRVTGMIHKYRDGRPPAGPFPAAGIRGEIDTALADYDFRAATEAVQSLAARANRHISEIRPWELARTGQATRLEEVLRDLYGSLVEIREELAIFLPSAADRIGARLTAAGGRLPQPGPVFRRLAA